MEKQEIERAVHGHKPMTNQAMDDFASIAQDAHDFTEFERNMTISQALQLYGKAAAFSVILSISLVMEAYDGDLLGDFFAYPAFQKKFGDEYKPGHFQLSASWQSGLQNGVQAGEIMGLWVSGILAERYGYRKTMIANLVLMIGVIFVMFFAQDIRMLMAGEFLCGLPWGAFQTLAATYAADVSPPVLRPYLTTFGNLCILMGQIVSTGILNGLVDRTELGDWAWRIPYAIQWVWPVPLIIGCLAAPESPWWLVRQNRIEDAKQALRRLASPKDSEYDLDKNVAMMIHTNACEKAISSGTSYKDCFSGVNLRRTEITCMVCIIQVSCGIWFGAKVIYFLEQAGFPPAQAFNFGLGKYAVGLLGTLCSWWAMRYAGRRTLYLCGQTTMLILLGLIGLLGIPESSQAIAYTSGAFLMVFTFTFDITVGPVCYCLMAEMPSTRLRVKTVALARNCYNLGAILANFLEPPILNPTAWNLGGKGGFVWIGFAALSLLWAYFRLPEPRGLSVGEIDARFQQGISARKFVTADVGEFHFADTAVVADKAEANRK